MLDCSICDNADGRRALARLTDQAGLLAVVTTCLPASGVPRLCSILSLHLFEAVDGAIDLFHLLVDLLLLNIVLQSFSRCFFIFLLHLAALTRDFLTSCPSMQNAHALGADLKPAT